jgi:hypothetical protein
VNSRVWRELQTQQYKDDQSTPPQNPVA